MSPLLVVVLAIIAVFGVASLGRALRMEIEHRRRRGRSRPRRPGRAP